jgi:hypothetical protein
MKCATIRRSSTKATTPGERMHKSFMGPFAVAILVFLHSERPGNMVEVIFRGCHR